ncbi:hypothetical protein RN001_008218 [Aquatica leii]|uniref:Uncharacterized protein n=1 Tax=Aquatica leii TaxID=1421715 RepID=A0AAN7PYZ5_9COLE|nr:hypothetical protein RN001_008218 [Aquatica leii]
MLSFPTSFSEKRKRRDVIISGRGAKSFLVANPPDYDERREDILAEALANKFWTSEKSSLNPIIYKFRRTTVKIHFSAKVYEVGGMPDWLADDNLRFELNAIINYD